MMTTKKRRAVYLIVFTVYMLTVLNITVFRFGSHYAERQINLSLFSDLIDVYHNAGTGRFVYLFFGNIAWFLPFGFLLPLLLNKTSLIKVAAAGFMFSFVIEASQYVFRKGVAELDDLLLNTLGVVIGYGLYRLLRRLTDGSKSG